MSFAQALGAIGSMIGSFTGSFSSGGGTNMKESAGLMALQNRYYRDNTKWINEEGWKMLRQGLINADYNPLLALGTSPQQGYAPTAQATNDSISYSQDGAASMQANTAREMSKSQIMLNKATASKTVEEALTQQNIRQNYDSDTAFKIAQTDRLWKMLPYEQRKMVAETLALNSTAGLNQITAKYVPMNSIANERNSYANVANSRNASWSRIVGNSVFDDIKRSLISSYGDKKDRKAAQKSQEYLNYLR